MASHFVLLGVLAQTISSAKAGFISITTPRQSSIANTTFTLLNYQGYAVDFSCRTKAIKFGVKSCRDAWIGLMENVNTSTALYNVAIGGWNNSKTVLYPGKMQGPHLREHYGELLDCNSYKTFQMKWENGNIKLLAAHGLSWVEILSYLTLDTTRIKFIGVTTSAWEIGEWRMFIHAEYISFTTPMNVNDADIIYNLINDNGYAIDLTCGQKYIKFEVKACRDAFIGLMETNNTYTPLYKFIIGGWHNSKTVLRRKNINTHLIEHNGGFLNCHSFKTFIVKWANETIKLSALDGNSWVDVLSYSTPDTTRIKFIGITTSKWANGEWNVFVHEPITNAMTSNEDATTTGSVTTTETVKMTTPAITDRTPMGDLTTSAVATPATKDGKTTGDVTTSAVATPATKDGKTTGDVTTSAVATPATKDGKTTGDLTTSAVATPATKDGKTTGDITTTQIGETTETTMTTSPKLRTNITEMCPESGLTNVSDTTTCTRVCLIDITPEQLMEEIKKLKEELTVNKKSLSRQKNLLISADDKRQSASTIGYVGVVIIASLFTGIVLTDLPNLLRMIRLMYRNITS